MMDMFTHDNPSQGEFLSVYFGRVPSGYIELFYLWPEGMEVKVSKPRFPTYAPLPLNRAIPDTIEQVREHNNMGYGVYFGTTPTMHIPPSEQRTSKQGFSYTVQPRRKERDVCYLPAVWCDVDDVPESEGISRFMDLPYLPTAIVRSGGGLHGYWIFREPVLITDQNRAQIKKLLHALALATNGDVKCRDLARIMRLPGTVNTKPERNYAPCKVIWTTDFLTSYSTIARCFAPFMPRELPPVTRPMQQTNSDELPPVTRKYLDNPPKKGDRNTRLYAAARGCLDAGLSEGECHNRLNQTARSTGLSEHEIEITIGSAYRAARGLISTTHTTRMALNDRRR